MPQEFAPNHRDANADTGAGQSRHPVSGQTPGGVTEDWDLHGGCQGAVSLRAAPGTAVLAGHGFGAEAAVPCRMEKCRVTGNRPGDAFVLGRS